MAYSIALRKKVIEFIGKGHSQREAAQVFGLHKETVNQWHQQYTKTGSLEKKPYIRKFRKLDPEKLKAYIAEHPDAYLKEIGEVFACSDVAVLKTLRRLGITRKKRLSATRNKTR
jgi:transposase